MSARDSFLAARQTGLGGSDMAAILGLSPFTTPLEVYLSKRGELPPTPDTSLTKAGRIMEQVIAAMYAEKAGVKVRRCNLTIRHPQHEFLIGHIDRDVVGVRRGVEIKNVSPRIGYRWGKDGEPGGIAEYYLPQVHHYMLVMDYPVFDVAAYFGGDDLRVYPLERDPEWDEILLDAGADFWRNHVVPGVPPPVDAGHPSTLGLLRRMYPGTNGEVVLADESDAAWAVVAREATAKAGEYSKVADSAKAHLLDRIGEAAVLRFPDGSEFRRKEVSRKGYTVEPSIYVDARFAVAKKD
jgi:putative phage-type endonuclease